MSLKHYELRRLCPAAAQEKRKHRSLQAGLKCGQALKNTIIILGPAGLLFAVHIGHNGRAFYIKAI